MPERPDLEYVVPKLADELVGVQIASVEVAKPVVVRMAVRGTVAAALKGRRFEGVRRRGHFVHFTLDAAVDLVIAPMLAGRFRIDTGKGKGPADRAVIFGLADGRRLLYRDRVEMGKVYVVEQGRDDVVPGLSTLGVDVLNPERFTRAAFGKLAKKRRDQVKVFLLDKTALDSLGNAYADEVMFAAGLHPKLRVRELSEDQLDRLHGAIITVLTKARDEIARRQPALDDKVRDFLCVRNRKGQPCVVCGTKIRTVGVRGHDAFLCPKCQPDTKGRGFVDWSKVKK